MSPEERAAVDDEVEAQLEEAVAYARASEWPHPDEAFQDMYVTNYPGLPARGCEWNAN